MSKDDRWDNFEKFSSRKKRYGDVDERKERKKKRKMKIRQERRNRSKVRDGWE